MEQLLNLLKNDARLSDKELAVMTGTTEAQVAKAIAKYEADGVIRGYRAIVDNEKVQDETVTALIEIKVHPKMGIGFDEIATRISELEEVESVYLMSGAYDLCCMVAGKSFQEVAMFVAKRLSPLDSVLSTATHFILRRYKEAGVSVCSREDDRRKISL